MRHLLCALLACFAFLPAASASVSDRVQVGRPGQNATPGFPLALYVNVATLPDYRPTNPFDGDSRIWEGPAWRAATINGKAVMSWQVSFFPSGTAAATATRMLVQKWTVVERPRVQIPHLVGKRRVGSIPAVALLTEGPGDNNAQYESSLAFTLCRGVLAGAQFGLLTPGVDYGTGPSDPVLVKGNVPSGDWNHDRALDALGKVTLEGYLPLGRVTARAAGRSVRGVVRDCRGHPMPGLGLRLVRGSATVARARAAADGSYRLNAPGPGSYRVTAALTVTGKGGSGTRQDARAATVQVR